MQNRKNTRKQIKKTSSSVSQHT